eukprot:14877145-Ditylum_brightwellii.AAC.1
MNSRTNTCHFSLGVEESSPLSGEVSAGLGLRRLPRALPGDRFFPFPFDGEGRSSSSSVLSEEEGLWLRLVFPLGRFSLASSAWVRSVAPSSILACSSSDSSTAVRASKPASGGATSCGP